MIDLFCGKPHLGQYDLDCVKIMYSNKQLHQCDITDLTGKNGL